jgi:hypothetical protein
LSLAAALLLGGLAAADEIRGVIVKTDADLKEFTLEARGRGLRGKTLLFHFDKDTEIRDSKKPGKVADLTAGRRVVVTYETQDGQRVASRIIVRGGALAAAMPAAPSGDAISGTLRRIAYTEREIVVVSAGAAGKSETETTLDVPADVKISRDQKAVGFRDLKEGEQVVVHPEKRDGRLLARSIEIGATASKARPPADGKLERLRQILDIIDSFRQMLPPR